MDKTERKVGEKKFSCFFSSFPYLGDNKEIRVRKIDTFEESSNKMIKESAHKKDDRKNEKQIEEENKNKKRKPSQEI